jgi:hypothetical protein
MAKKAVKKAVKKAPIKKASTTNTNLLTKNINKMAKTKTLTAVPTKKVKKEKRITELDYSTAVIAPDAMQQSDKSVITFYCDNQDGEQILVCDLLHKLNPEARKALKL